MSSHHVACAQGYAGGGRRTAKPAAVAAEEEEEEEVDEEEEEEIAPTGKPVECNGPTGEGGGGGGRKKEKPPCIEDFDYVVSVGPPSLPPHAQTCMPATVKHSLGILPLPKAQDQTPALRRSLSQQRPRPPTHAALFSSVSVLRSAADTRCTLCRRTRVR